MLRFCVYTCGLILAVAICCQVHAQPTAAGAKQPPSDKAVTEMCGARLAKVFAKFGPPEDLLAVRGSDVDSDAVKLSYGDFGFQVRDKTVTICYFWSEWKGAVRGVSIGDSRNKVLKAMGTADHAEKNKDEVEDLGWELKDDDAVFWTVFDKDDKVSRIQVELK